MKVETLVITFILYLFFLSMVAKYIESKDYQNLKSKRLIDKIIYILGFGAYCTTWTYYGSIEGVTNSGVKFLTVYFGPALSSIFWVYLLRKMVIMKNKFGITNIPDLLNVLYQNSKVISKVVSVFFMVGLIPYIALQLKSVTKTTHFILQKPLTIFDSIDLLIALSFIIFAIYFGEKKVKKRNSTSGLSAVIAVESITKLLGILIIGIYVTYFKLDGFQELFSTAEQILKEKNLDSQLHILPKMSSWVSITFLSFFAFLFLPRQFQMSIVENKNIDDIQSASWAVPLYLFLINIFIIPIALYGLAFLPKTISSDLYLLGIPFSDGNSILTLLVFLGGYSAAAGMIVLEVTALTTMITNTVILPFLQKRNSPFTIHLIFIKRLVMVCIIFISYIYMIIAGNTAALISMGLISFTCVFQIAPTIIGGLLWKKAHRNGAIASLISGITIWAYTLFLPAFFKSFPETISIIEMGPLGISLLKPYALLGISIFDPITHCIFWSMLISVPAYILFSIRGSAREMLDNTNNEYDIDSDIKITINCENLFMKIESVLNRYFPLSESTFLLDKIKRSIKDATLKELNENDFITLIKTFEVILFENIGAIAAENEIKWALSKNEQKTLEQSMFKKMQRQIVAQKKIDSLTELTKGLAHELNNPINILLNAGTLLTENLEKELPKKDLEEITHMINNNINRTHNIVQKLLHKSKLSSMEKTNENISILLKDIISNQKKISRKRFSFDIDFEYISNQSLNFNFSKKDIQLALTNIVENSIYSLEKKKLETQHFHPKIIIHLNHQMHKVEISIEDNGFGIPASILEKVMSPFFSDKPTGKGNLGLGLSTASDIIYAHNGEFKIDSKVGKWTKTTIFLPID